MHFYDFNIGDYAKKTQHLTNEEDLAYRRLLDLYYDTEKPIAIPSLNGGIATLSRRLRVSEIALKNVLEEFFPDGKNKHADEKIAAYYAFIEKQSSNGKLGGRPKHKGSKPTANPPLTQALPTDNPPPSQPLPTNHYPLTNNQDKNMPPLAEAVASFQTDPKKLMFDMGVSLLTKTGASESSARSFIAKYAKHSEEKLMEVMGYLAANPKVEPKAYIAAAMRDATDPVYLDLVKRYGNGVKRTPDGGFYVGGRNFTAEGKGGLCL